MRRIKTKLGEEKETKLVYWWPKVRLSQNRMPILAMLRSRLLCTGKLRSAIGIVSNLVVHYGKSNYP